MSSPDRHEKKHRRKKVSPYADESDVKFNKSNNYQYHENSAYDNEDRDILNLEKPNNKTEMLKKFQDAAEKAQYHSNAINLITNVKQGASRWRKYTTSKRIKLKRAESAGGRNTGGQGLADIEEDFIADSKSTSRQMVVASNRTLLQYFGRLGSSENFDECIDLDFVESLFKNGARVDCTDKYGQTIFHEVARAWHVDVAKFLLENGGDPNVTDSYGRTPLHVASAVDYAEMVKFLIQNGANKEACTKGENQTPVHYAARNDACLSLKSLVKLGCEYKMVRDFKKRTPLQLAAELDRSETAALLLELGAPVGVQDDSGQPCIVWMITKMAPVAKEGLNQFHVTDRANRKQYYFLNHLEPKPPVDATKTQCQTAVAVMCKRHDLIIHKAFMRLIKVKWNRFGRLGAWSNLIFNFVFILLWTILGVYPDWNIRYKYNLPEDTWRIIIWIAAITLTVYQIVVEILEYRNSKKKHEAWKDWRLKELDRDKNFCHPRWPEEYEYIMQEQKELDKVAPQYFNDMWNIFDWVCYVLLLSCIVTHIADCSMPTHSVLLAHAHIRIMAVNIILLWLRLMKNARAFSTLGPFIAMLGHIMSDVMKFLFLFMEFYIPYLCAFWMIFGGINTLDKYLQQAPTDLSININTTVPGYKTFGEVFFSLFKLTMVDDYPYDEMKSVDPIMTDILVGTWFALSAILCLNLFIALMSDTFQRVYDNALANAVMQQALTLMSCQDGSGISFIWKSRVKAFDTYIRDVCSPEALYYDDDMTPSEDDQIRKVTFEIKDNVDDIHELIVQHVEPLERLNINPDVMKMRDDLEEIKEWFHAKFGPVDSMNDPESAKKQRALGGGLTVETLEGEIDILRHELQDISASQQEFQSQYSQDMDDLKSLLEQVIINQSGGGGGSRLRSEEPVYEDPYQPVRDEESRRSRRKEKKKRSKPRQSDVLDVMEDPSIVGRGLDVDPQVEVRPLGRAAAEPPPQNMGMGFPDTTDA